MTPPRFARSAREPRTDNNQCSFASFNIRQSDFVSCTVPNAKNSYTRTVFRMLLNVEATLYVPVRFPYNSCRMGRPSSLDSAMRLQRAGIPSSVNMVRKRFISHSSLIAEDAFSAICSYAAQASASAGFVSLTLNAILRFHLSKYL